jgi:hypothetical protein
MAFKASKAKSGLFEIHGLEAFIEKQVALAVAGFKKAFGVTGGAKKRPAAKAARKAAPAKATAKDPLSQLLANLDSHPKKAGLIKAGKQKDQLLRSLIPLYVAKGVEVSSGTTSKFWAKHGVTYAAPNVAKALREHVGYARRGAKGGPQITPNGIKYVEQALSGKRTAA